MVSFPQTFQLLIVVDGTKEKKRKLMIYISANCLFAIKKELQEPITAEEVGSYKIRVEQAVAMGRLAQLCLTNDDRKNDFCGTIKNTLVQTLKLGLQLSEALSDAAVQWLMAVRLYYGRLRDTSFPLLRWRQKALLLRLSLAEPGCFNSAEQLLQRLAFQIFRHCTSAYLDAILGLRI